MLWSVPPEEASGAEQSEPELLVLPVRVHLLTSSTVPELNSTLSEREIREVLVEANGVWSQAGIRWEVESVRVFFPERRQVLWSELTPRGEMHATVLAHELGHSLCLSHDSESPDNLMRAGPRGPSTATGLTPAQIAVARRQAATGSPQGLGSVCRDGG